MNEEIKIGDNQEQGKGNAKTGGKSATKKAGSKEMKATKEVVSKVEVASDNQVKDKKVAVTFKLSEQNKNFLKLYALAHDKEQSAIIDEFLSKLREDNKAINELFEKMKKVVGG